jgi:hypothetical protein
VYLRSRAGFAAAVIGVSGLFGAAGTTRAIPFSWVLRRRSDVARSGPVRAPRGRRP